MNINIYPDIQPGPVQLVIYITELYCCKIQISKYRPALYHMNWVVSFLRSPISPKGVKTCSLVSDLIGEVSSHLTWHWSWITQPPIKVEWSYDLHSSSLIKLGVKSIVSVYKYKLRTCMVQPVYLLLFWSYTSEGWVQWGHLIMGKHGCAAASLWLGHAPSISLAIGPRHPSYWQKQQKSLYLKLTLTHFTTYFNLLLLYHILLHLLFTFTKSDVWNKLSSL